jgi:SnoaL-like domain
MAEAAPAGLPGAPGEMAEARGEIENLLERYCWLSDHGQLDEWAACFAPAAVLRIRDTELRGRDTIRLEMGERLRRRFRFLRHLSHQASVSLLDESHAVARGYFELRGATAEGREIEALGSYEDELVKTTEGWKFSCRVVDFTYFVHRGDPWEGDLFA